MEARSLPAVNAAFARVHAPFWPRGASLILCGRSLLAALNLTVHRAREFVNNEPKVQRAVGENGVIDYSSSEFRIEPWEDPIV